GEVGVLEQDQSGAARWVEPMLRRRSGAPNLSSAGRRTKMSDPEGSPPANREFVFRTIQLLMIADIAIGAALVLLGLFVYDFPALAIAGFLALHGNWPRGAVSPPGPARGRRDAEQPTPAAPMTVRPTPARG